MFLHIVHYVFCTRGERSSIRLFSKNIKIIAKLNIQNFFNSRTGQNSEGLTLKRVFFFFFLYISCSSWVLVLILFGYIYIFISNLFFSLLCDRVIVFKTYLMDNLKDFIFVNVVKYLYLYLSIDSIFPWNVWKHYTRFNLLEFFHKWYKFIFYIVLHCLCWRLLA